MASELVIRSTATIRDKDGNKHVLVRRDRSDEADAAEHERDIIQELIDRALVWGSTFVALEQWVGVENSG